MAISESDIIVILVKHKEFKITKPLNQDKKIIMFVDIAENL